MRIKNRRGFIPAIVGMALTVHVLWGAPSLQTQTRILELVRQLGHEDYSAREAASRELAEIGEPAVSTSQSAAATDADTEIRWRAQRVLEGLAIRRREAAGRQDLEKFQGTWYTVSTSHQGTTTPENRNDTITFEGNRYVQTLDGNLLAAGEITISDATASPKQMEYDASDGPYAGSYCWSIYRVEGSDLILCSQMGNAAVPARPGAFSDRAGFVRVLKRVEKPRTK
jgi:uncharacterized protein (TIGR03067 family)